MELLDASHNAALVAMSCLVALVAGFTGLSLTRNLSDRPVAQRKLAIALGSVALGGGIWSMHFVAMLGLQLPILFYYDAAITLASALVAILIVAGALILLHFTERTTGMILAAGGLLGGLLGGGGILPGARGGEYQVNRFQPLGEGGLGAKVEFPNTVRFWGAWTPMFDEIQKPHDEFELEQIQQDSDPKYRVVYTHVFPGGYMEDTVVYVSDQTGEDITSLLVEPLIGRVVVEEGEAEIPDTRDRDTDR